MKPAAIILCGGESRRMGRPKADLPFGPETLLQRVVRLISAVAAPVVVAAAHRQPLPDLPEGVVVVRDPPVPAGPLQGIASALTAIPTEAELVYVASVDAPFFEAGWLAMLVDRIGEFEAAIPVVEGVPNPLCALYRSSPMRRAVEALLAGEERRAGALRRALAALDIPETELRRTSPDLRPLRNVNSPEDYQAALRLEFPA